MRTTNIRSLFLDYFRRNGHSVVSSSSLVPQNDKTLLFTNAGMVQFKDVFVGLEKRDYTRATTSQKCVRAGGKHNDLDQVGFTARHHTFFEMLGNFSFGDYFKEDAIEFAWNFITKELGINKNKLLATVYHTDDEAAKIWKKVAGNDFNIIPISTNDNFWSMGDIGPCGPCTEIFYDHGEHIKGGVPGSPDEDGDRFVEIWNIVFMQFEQLANGERIPLKSKSIDTGMGLERIAAVMQGKCDNYDTDIFASIMGKMQDLLNVEISAGNKSSFKVIADHLRSLSFLITDGVFPSNEGRGYVLRRILRRAVRHANMLGAKDAFLYKLVPQLVKEMSDAYPELSIMENNISSTIKTEEEKFIATLDKGLSILNDEISGLSNGDTLEGKVAFKLYDTYGFPLDLTQDILKSKGISVDEAGFKEAMDEQKNRANWKNSAYDKSKESVYYDIKSQICEQKFNGYEVLSETAKIKAIVVDGEKVDSVSNGRASIITENTPFYAECGGQVGDIGSIKKPLGNFVVDNTRKVGELIIHEGYVENGTFSEKENVTLSVCQNTRKSTAAHHSATHLLQAALKKVLGNHVAQKGSYVCQDYLRFDFSHNASMSNEQIAEVENLVNEWIMMNVPVNVKLMSKDDAVRSGAMALFGEKYEDTVRVVSMGDEDLTISSELCGGTHVCQTGEIGLFKIKSEASIGSGLRRIEAIAGKALLSHFNALRQKLNMLNDMLKASDDEIIDKISALNLAAKSLEKDLLKARMQLAIESSKCQKIGDITVQIARTEGISIKDARSIIDTMCQKLDKGVAILYNVDGEKVNVLCASTKGLSMAKKALDAALPALSGHGGGKNDFAQGGGTNPSMIDKSIEDVLTALTDYSAMEP